MNKSSAFRSLSIVLVILLFANYSVFGQINIAPLATSSTSYISSWETLSALNDGFEPSGSSDHLHGAYGNWQSGVTNHTNWVQYTFPDYYKISRSDVYWWTDYNGIAIPYNSFIQYWSISQNTWVNVSHPDAYGFEIDKYNRTNFDAVLTNKIRMSFVSVKAQGILEWKVFGEKGEQIPSLSTISISPALSKGTTSTITVTARNKNSIPVSGYVFKLDAIVSDALSQNKEVYLINGQSTSENIGNMALPATNVAGQVAFNVTMPAVIDPTDGIELALKFNEEHTLLKSYRLFETGLTAPTLSADVTSNTVDNDIELTFTDNEAWRIAISGVTVGETALDQADFTFSAGKITLKPSAGNGLSTVGVKLIAVTAAGYNKVQVSQNLRVGAVDFQQSTVSSQLKLFKSVTIPVTVKAADRFGNPVSGYVFNWDATVINSTTLNNEKYFVNGDTVTTSLTGHTLKATNASGLTSFMVSIPAVVNMNDGIQIQVKTATGESVQPIIRYVALSTEKQIYVDYKLRTFEWSYSKSAQSDNFIIFWGNLVGTDPLHPANGSTAIAFDPVNILNLLENNLTLYVDSFKFIPNKNEGNMGRYKFQVVITDTWNNSGYANGYANGGSTDGVIGAMWVHPSATGGSGFVLSHEFAHMCQAMIPIQYPGKGILDPSDKSYNLGMFWESHANFMGFTASGDVERANPQRFVNTAMMNFSSTSHYYENNYFLQYLYDKYGMETINKIWQNATQGMHPLQSFKANKAFSQSQLNDEFGSYAMHNVTWDYSIKDKISRVLKNQGYPVVCREYTYLDKSNIDTAVYVVPRYMAPADYGYNIIPLYPDAGATKITVNFAGYANANSGGAGWRYGFVAVDKLGVPRYSDLSSSTTGDAVFDITAEDVSLYLVVTGAPAQHHNYVWTPGWPKVYRYPYSLKMTGAVPAGYKAGYNSQKADYPLGKNHTNGGGWVASTATVASTVYVGPNAQVLGTANVSGKARIEDYAIITDKAVISGNAIIRGNSMVGSTSKVRENAIVEKSARVFYTSDIYGNALITGSAIVYSSAVSGYAVVKDLAWLNNATLSGTILVGGDAEGFTSCTSGIYLQSYGLRNCDGLEIQALNGDVNPVIPEYGSALSRPTLAATAITQNSATLNWTASSGGVGNFSYLVLNGTTVIAKTQDPIFVLTALLPKTTYKYTVIARDNEGNQSAKSNELTVVTDSVYSGVNDVAKPEGYKCYPNPAKGNVTLECEGTAVVKIYDNLGRCVYNEFFTGSTNIPTSKIGSDGLYVVQLTLGKKVVTDKLMILSSDSGLKQ